MKSMFRSFLAMALMVCAAFAWVCDSIAAPVAKAYQAVKRCLTGWALSALALASVKTGLDLNQISIFASAKAFVLRLAKRERPELTASWRMCPST